MNKLVQTLIILLVFGIAGCNTTNVRTVVLDKIPENIKKINLLQFAEQEEIPITVWYKEKNTFGFVGRFVETEFIRVQTKKINEQFRLNVLNLAPDFYKKITPIISMHGYEINSLDFIHTPELISIDQQAFQDNKRDSVLSLRITGSYNALTVETDYFPSVYVNATLYDIKTKKIIYLNRYRYGFNTGSQTERFYNAANECRFKNIDAISRDHKKAAKCLTDGVDILVKAIADDFKR